MKIFANGGGGPQLTCKAGTVDILYPVVWNQEFFLPPHKDGASISIVDGQARALSLMSDVTECREARPMDEIFIFASAPILG